MSVLRTALTAAAPSARAVTSTHIRCLSTSSPRAIAASVARRAEASPSASASTSAAAASSSSASASSDASLPTPQAPGSALNLRPPPLATLGYTKDNLPTQTDPTLAFFVGILMRDGKKASSSRTAMDVLVHLYDWTSSPPLPMFQQAIARASPLVRMQSSKSGGKIVQIPIPLNPRQSMHRGIKAIIDASKKRNDRYISTRLAREIIAVLEGSSPVLSRKEEQHKVAMANRANASVRI
ncbi:unnamed protein product [Tilletia controversa]|uniref:Small ribosomal subunit protein uS7 domain-containing protein n=3 Tax=Tilletia TaxID=13289 RepID=A0A8X7N2B0_9BASI|nr:hypothetical protein CF336_g268 [Tilletia laevis]KAE8205537.1 hypothetical protein CF328_g434 [Tilletia controversa]KAE8265493.1 hypothetical protein A4X03_0g226 [Tilletia caries]KAE8208731.1 hypothetical protein CF335_g187 [Tilletia laevis]KAE8256150.1 hypothetical protein A4X06_0g36 [Tilletia controversa]